MADPMTHTEHQTHEAAAGGTHHPAAEPIPAGHEAHAAHEVSHGQQHHPSSVTVSSSIPHYGYPYYGHGYGYPYPRRVYDDNLLDRRRASPRRSQPRAVSPPSKGPKSFLGAINIPTLIVALVISALVLR